MSKKQKRGIFSFKDLPPRVVCDEILVFRRSLSGEFKDMRINSLGIFKKSKLLGEIALRPIFQTFFFKHKFEGASSTKIKYMELGIFFNMNTLNKLKFENLRSLTVYSWYINDLMVNNKVELKDLKKLTINFYYNEDEEDKFSEEISTYVDTTKIRNLFSNISNLKMLQDFTSYYFFDFVDSFRIILLCKSLKKLTMAHYFFDLDIFKEHEFYIENNLKIENIFLKENFNIIGDALKNKFNYYKNELLVIYKPKEDKPKEDKPTELELEHRKKLGEVLHKIQDVIYDYNQSRVENLNKITNLENIMKFLSELESIVIIKELDEFQELEKSFWDYFKKKYPNVKLIKYLEEEEEEEDLLEVEKKYF